MSFKAAAIAGSTLAGIGASRSAGAKAARAQRKIALLQAQLMREGRELAAQAAERGREDVAAQFDPSLSALQQGFTGAIGELRAETPAAQMQAALSGALGPEAERQAIESFIESPGQRFLREEQEQALLRSQAAIGGLGGGRVRSALQEQALGRAAGLQQQRFANLGTVAGREQLQQANIANILASQGRDVSALRTGFGANLANIALQKGAQQTQISQAFAPAQAAAIGGIGQAQAAARLGTGFALQQGLSQLAQLFGQRSAPPPPPPTGGGGGSPVPAQFQTGP